MQARYACSGSLQRYLRARSPPGSPSVQPSWQEASSSMHLQIVEAGEQLTLRCVANGPHCQAMWIGLSESRSAGGTEQTAGMLSGQLFGPGGNTTPEDIGSMGGEYGPLR